VGPNSMKRVKSPAPERAHASELVASGGSYPSLLPCTGITSPVSLVG
jgi:hypothetical protein